MSTTYNDYKKQIAELQQKAEHARNQEIAAAREQIFSILRDYDLTVADLETTSRKKSNLSRKPVEIKYRNQETGETWTGRGRAPKWLEGKKKEDFLV